MKVINSKYQTISQPIYNQNTLVDFLSKSGFVPNSLNPKISTLASIIEYHKLTNNYGFDKIIYLKQDNKTVGVLLLLAFPLIYCDKEFYCIQGAAGYIMPEHRGTFKFIVNTLLANYKNTVKLFMFSAPAVHRNAKQLGFIEIENGKFNTNKYIIIQPIAFFSEIINTPIIKKAFRYLTIFDKLFGYRKKNKAWHINEDPLFTRDYALIEDSYKKKYYNKIVPKWNKDILIKKYKKSAGFLNEKHENNSTFVVVALDKKERAIASMVIKRIPKLNRLVIVEIETIEPINRQIIFEMLAYMKFNARKNGINSIMFNGIGDEYEHILKQKSFVINKKVEMKCFMHTDIEDVDALPKQVILNYSADDINF